MQGKVRYLHDIISTLVHNIMKSMTIGIKRRFTNAL